MSIRLGIVDCDTSHVVAFTQRLNHLEIAEDQWVDGAQIVAAVPLPSQVSPERVEPFTEKLRGYGVEILQRPEELIGKVDGVLVESVDGSVHHERAMPFLAAGLPVWIDKPFTCSTAEARALVDEARRRGVPLMSASALRYDLPVQDIQGRHEEIGPVLGVDAYTPASLHPRNPGLFHYAVHGVEMVYALMGTGCRRVRCTHQEGVDFAVGEWDDGRLATVRGTRQGKYGLGFTAFAERAVVSAASSGYYYRELLKRVVGMFQTGESPMSGAELIEAVAFQEAANRSMAEDGRPVTLEV
ncbi:MAG TPA: Gfo/Idh/MocA family oxidoreductase [Chloroflexota bacterium]|nr:Gfo/Idh/MocA family oxidoreductase [Chloroflexota bacterium]